MPDVIYSVSLEGTADKKSGSPTIDITSGVATLSVAQPNAVIGDRITYNTTSIAYIKVVNSTTSFDLITATGGTPGNVTGQTVNSIAFEYASQSAFEAGFTDASHINNTDLTATGAAVSAGCYCYEDSVDQTIDTTAVIWLGATTDATYDVTVQGDDTTATYSSNAYTHEGEIRNFLSNINFYNLNKENNDGSAAGQDFFLRQTGATDYVKIHYCHIKSVDQATLAAGALYGVYIGFNTGGTCDVKDCVFEDFDGSTQTNTCVQNDSSTAGTGGGCDLNVYNCTFINQDEAIFGSSTPTNLVKNNITQDGGLDYVGTFDTTNSGYNLTDSATPPPGTNNVTSTTLTFSNKAGGDYQLASGDTSAHTAGIGPSSDASVLTSDKLGTSRSGTTCSIGAFEYVAPAAGGAVYRGFFTNINKLGLR